MLATAIESEVSDWIEKHSHIRSDNDPEFVARVVTRWLYRAGVKTLFIAKGSPWENGYVESFNSRFRDELLNRELFTGLEVAR